jgi:hypothetical protein
MNWFVSELKKIRLRGLKELGGLWLRSLFDEQEDKQLQA